MDLIKDDKKFLIIKKKDALKKYASGERLTLEETALAIWDPATQKKPMTTMGILKIEKKALAKLKIGLKKYGINDISDVLDARSSGFGMSTFDVQHSIDNS